MSLSSATCFEKASGRDLRRRQLDLAGALLPQAVVRVAARRGRPSAVLHSLLDRRLAAPEVSAGCRLKNARSSSVLSKLR